MGTFNLNWTPPGGLNSTAQQVQYKASTSSTWLVATTLGATDDSYTVEDLLDNVLYDFRIVNMCASGGPIPGSTMQAIDFVCPTVNATPTSDTIGFNFVHLGGSITQYEVELLNGAGNTTLATKTINSPGSVVADSFTGLSATTSYNLRVTCMAGVHEKVCPLVPVMTTVVPTCGIPSGLVVSIV